MPGTRATLEARIADDLVDAPVTSTQITDAVSDAIRHYETQRFSFNEAGNVTHTFSASNDVVPLTNILAGAAATYFVKIDRLRMQYSGAQNLTDLYPRDYDWLMDSQDAKSVTRPLEYCVYAEAINFDAIPDQAYVGVIDGVKRLSTTSSNSFSTSSSVSWFTDGALLLRYRAERDLLINIARDDDEAAKKVALEMDELKRLRQRLNTRNSGRIRPTSF